MEELIIDSIVSSKNFYLNNLTKPILENEDILAYKLKIKINEEYKDALSSQSVKPNKYGEKQVKLNLTEDQKEQISDGYSKNIISNENKFLNHKRELDDIKISKQTTDIVLQENIKKLANIPEKYKIDTSDGKNDNLVLSLFKNQTQVGFRKNKLVNPEWHAPWKLYRVISGHTGWVRCIDVDPTNNWFVTGSNDKMIKFWDLASGRLKLSLTGHINTIRGLVVSPRHPYLFSCSEDKTIRCWDLEQNKTIREYHGHLSGVYCLTLHPSLDIIITGGRDCVARVWDLRSRKQIFCLEGHNNSICSIASQEYNPQLITGSHDSTVKLWDIGTGKCMNTLTHHKKSIRSLVVHDQEYTFITGIKYYLYKLEVTISNYGNVQRENS
jgi:pleiotropic regulator 1